MPLVEHKKISAYNKYLKEPSRPPSKGGNTNALHQHVLEINGDKFSFLALGSQQWVFIADLVSFEYEVTDQGYKNIVKETLKTIDSNGQEVVRGNRGHKPKLRTVAARLPGSKREQRD